jgi:hypothetical protein
MQEQPKCKAFWSKLISRLNVIAAGEDSSVDKDSELARKLVRKAFRVK